MDYTLKDLIKTAEKLVWPEVNAVIKQAVKDLEEYPSNYNMGVLLKLLGDILIDN